jgi:hypothetical protein
MTKINFDIKDKKYRLLVYTALFDDYDYLIDPREKFEGCDFICFTDQKQLKSDFWEIRLIDKCDLPPNMMNRKYKILPHLFIPSYERSLYIDPNIAILKNPKDLSDKYLNHLDFAVPKHFLRNCVYDEAKECIILIKDKKNNIKKQIQRYKKANFPAQFGLSENNILLRNHLEKSVLTLMDCWWLELKKETMRDQLSLPYVMWKENRVYNFMAESARQDMRGGGLFWLASPSQRFN